MARVVFRAKTWLLDIKSNHKNNYNLKCLFCSVLDKIFDHIFTCGLGTRVLNEIDTIFLRYTDVLITYSPFMVIFELKSEILLTVQQIISFK